MIPSKKGILIEKRQAVPFYLRCSVGNREILWTSRDITKPGGSDTKQFLHHDVFEIFWQLSSRNENYLCFFSFTQTDR